MLYVKNMVFLDGAIARLAPDLDLFAEIANITMYFAQTHGEKLFADIGVDPSTFEIDLDGVKSSFGVDPTTERLTYRELRERGSSSAAASRSAASPEPGAAGRSAGLR